MPTYYINEAAFDVPEMGFSDQTVHLLRAKASRTGDINVMTFRSKVEGDAGLREVVASHRDNERRTLAGFASLLDREVEVAGTVAIEAAIRYRGDDTHQQVLTYLQEQFGALDKAPGQMIRGLNQQFNWRGPHTEINVTFEAQSGRGFVFIESRVLSPRFNDALTDSGQ